MKYRWLGWTGIRVSALALGCSPFGSGFGSVSGVDQGGANDLVARALDAGVNLFDTADEYSRGESEELLGRALGRRRHEAMIASKVGWRFEPGPNGAGASRWRTVRQLEGSHRRLGTDYIDLYYVHIFDPYTAPEELLSTLDALIHAGKIRYAGVSNYPAWRVMEARCLTERHGWEGFVAYQGLWNLLVRDVEDEIVQACRALGMGFLSWSPLAGGWLTGKYRRGAPRPTGARLTRPDDDYLRIDEDRAENLVCVLDAIAAPRGATVGQIALAWQLAKPWLTAMVVGAKTLRQLEENLGAVEIELTPEEIGRLETAAPKPRRWPAWQIELNEESRTDAAR
jgi:aryl-alcohol dehydrogenase-like predicted oxidoreductase